MPRYRTVHVDDVPNTPNPTREKKELDEALGISAFGCNYYEADPGESLPWGYHRHPAHEELFFVLAGQIAVETPETTYRVGSREAFFVPEDAPNAARAVGDRPARVLAIGAPKETDEAIIAEECPECGEESDRAFQSEGDEYLLFCTVCDAEVRRFSA